MEKAASGAAPTAGRDFECDRRERHMKEILKLFNDLGVTDTDAHIHKFLNLIADPMTRERANTAASAAGYADTSLEARVRRGSSAAPGETPWTHAHLMRFLDTLELTHLSVREGFS